MNKNLKRGALIVIENWLNINKGDRLLIVTNQVHKWEAEALRDCGEEKGAIVKIMVLKEGGMKAGIIFDEDENAFDDFDVIIGACEYSLVTTKAVKKAINGKKHFLSLPLSTNNNASMLTFDFMTMDTNISRLRAWVIMKYIEKSQNIRIITDLGTDITLGMKGRQAGFFNGNVNDGKGYSSASMEIYIPIEETKTNGKLVVDGSYGYIGRVLNPFMVIFKDGVITQIEDSEDGNKLSQYLKGYNDKRMYVAGELGIGMNSKAKCCGDCYIEDESAYGTFHLGVGRNLALGGVHEASGHFDIVSFRPDIYFDNTKIMEQGQIIIPEFRI